MRTLTAVAPDPPADVIAQAIEHLLHRHYASWADEAAPAPGGRTPRQAIVTLSGLERVRGLLREYEGSEQRQSAAQGRPAVALGVSR